MFRCRNAFLCIAFIRHHLRYSALREYISVCSVNTLCSRTQRDFMANNCIRAPRIHFFYFISHTLHTWMPSVNRKNQLQKQKNEKEFQSWGKVFNGHIYIYIYVWNKMLFSHFPYTIRLLSRCLWWYRTLIFNRKCNCNVNPSKRDESIYCARLFWCVADKNGSITINTQKKFDGMAKYLKLKWMKHNVHWTHPCNSVHHQRTTFGFFFLCSIAKSHSSNNHIFVHRPFSYFQWYCSWCCSRIVR